MAQYDQEPNTTEAVTFDAGRLLHAYIVVGPEGRRRDAFTDRLAAALVCSGGGAVPCGQCADCRKAFRGVHPDIIRQGRPADRAVFPVELIRSICADSAVMPNEAGRKVYVLTDGERMNAAAQNALLKTLEEPPPHCAYVLPVEDPSVFLPTVRSRCAQIMVPDEPAFDEQALADADRFLDLLAAAPLSPQKRKAKRDRADLYRVHNLNTGHIVGMLIACLTAPAGKP